MRSGCGKGGGLHASDRQAEGHHRPSHAERDSAPSGGRGNQNHIRRGLLRHPKRQRRRPGRDPRHARLCLRPENGCARGFDRRRRGRWQSHKARARPARRRGGHQLRSPADDRRKRPRGLRALRLRWRSLRRHFRPGGRGACEKNVQSPPRHCGRHLDSRHNWHCRAHERAGACRHHPRRAAAAAGTGRGVCSSYAWELRRGFYPGFHRHRPPNGGPDQQLYRRRAGIKPGTGLSRRASHRPHRKTREAGGRHVEHALEIRRLPYGASRRARRQSRAPAGKGLGAAVVRHVRRRASHFTRRAAI